MDLYNLVPRERPRLKSYGAFFMEFQIRIFQSKKRMTSRCWRNKPALDRESERKSSQLSYGHLRIDATFRYLNSVSSDSISTLAMIFVDLFFFQVDLREQGKLIVDGGNEKQGSVAVSGLGGGAGGIIHIISPAGRLPLNALSLKRGRKFGSCNEAEHGYHFVAGNLLWCTIQKYVKTIDLNSKNRGQ